MYLGKIKNSRFYVRSVYCSWKIFSDLNQNGCEIVRATVTPDIVSQQSRGYFNINRAKDIVSSQQRAKL